MLDKKNRPDLKGEMDELQRASQDLSRDYDIDVSVKDMVKAFNASTEQTISNEIWDVLKNTESNEIELGDFDAVEEIAKKYDKTDPKILAKALKSGVYKRPLIINIDDSYILVAGNTRLCTAAAMGMNPKVFIAKIKIDTNLEEKWSKKYKDSIDCSNPKGFSQKAHCKGKTINESEVLKGGLADNKDLVQLAKKHGAKNYYHIELMVKSLEKQLEKGIKVETEHTTDPQKAKEIAMDHLWEDPKYYSKLKKIEATEMTGADSAGAFSASLLGRVIKKKDITKIHNMTENELELGEVTSASSSVSFDVPFGGGGTKGRKNPLKIDGPDSIYKGRAVKDKNFPKWGGPGGKFVKIKDKCKKFPYCNQGDINALELIESKEMFDAMEHISAKRGISFNVVKNMVLKEIEQIFI
jgi:hypothetical protein